MGKKEQKMCEMIYENNKSIVLWYLRKHFRSLSEKDQFQIMQEVWMTVSDHIQELEKRKQDEQTAWIITVANQIVMAFLGEKEKYLGKGEILDSQGEKRRKTDEDVVQEIMTEGVLDKLTWEEKKVLVRAYQDPEEARRMIRSAGLEREQEKTPVINIRSVIENLAKETEGVNAFTSVMCEGYRVRHRIAKFKTEGDMHGKGK